MGQSALIKWLRVDCTWGTKPIHLMVVGGMRHSQFLFQKEDSFGSFSGEVDKI